MSPSKPNDDYNFWGIFGILISGYFAYQLIPDLTYSLPGALQYSALIMTCGLLLGPIAAGLKDPTSLFNVEHILMFGLTYWIILDPLQGSYYLGGASRVGIERVFLGVSCFAASVWIGARLVQIFSTDSPSPQKQQTDLSIRFLFWASIISFVLGIARILLTCNFSAACIVDSFVAERFEAAWATTRLGGYDTISQILGYFGYLTLPLAVALHSKEGRVTPRVVFAAILGLIYLILLMRDGGRRSVGTVLGASILVWLLMRPKISLKHLGVLAVLTYLLLLTMQVMLNWRILGFEGAVKNGITFHVAGRGSIAVDRNLLYFSQITTLVPDIYPHTQSRGVIYTIAAPIPRSLFPGKPTNHAFDLLGILGMKGGDSGFTWTCSCVGDFYLIGGFYGLLIGGIIFGILAALCSRELKNPPTVRGRLLFALGAMTLFVGVRAAHEIVVTGSIVLAMWSMLYLKDYWQRSDQKTL